MTLDEALARPASTDDVLTIACHIVVLCANREIVLTTSDESFVQGQRIPVRDSQWMLERMSSSLWAYAGGPVMFWEQCEITGRLRHRQRIPEFTNVSRCVIRGELVDHEGPSELILDRNEPTS